MKRIIVCSDGTMNTAFQTTRGGGQEYDFFSVEGLVSLLVALLPGAFLALMLSLSGAQPAVKLLGGLVILILVVKGADELYFQWLLNTKGKRMGLRRLVYRFFARSGSRTPSHVGKILRAVKPLAREKDGVEVPQLVFYDKGIGTGGFSDAVLGGGFGSGIKTNVLDCYDFIVQNYEEGDQLFFFGFSRGAFTVRVLAGLISVCGLLTKGDSHYAPEAYEIFKLQATKKAGKEKLLKAFRDGKYKKRTPYGGRNEAVRDVNVHFLGVWDTVPAIGLAGYLGRVGGWLGRHLRMNNYTLSKKVEYAYHALGLDENRRAFDPLLWDSPPRYEKDEPVVHKEMEQRWFAGIHTTIGGGFSKDELSYITLKWMVDKAVARGLQFTDQKFLDKKDDTLKTYLDFYMPDEKSYQDDLERNSIWVYPVEGFWKKRVVRLPGSQDKGKLLLSDRLSRFFGLAVNLREDSHESIDDSVYARLDDPACAAYRKRTWVAEIPPKE